MSWARLVVDQKDVKQATELLDDASFHQAAVRAAEAVTLYRLYKMAGDETASELLSEAVEAAVAIEDVSQLRVLAEVFGEEGRLPELEIKLTERLPPRMIEDIIEGSRRRVRRSRFGGQRYYAP